MKREQTITDLRRSRRREEADITGQATPSTSLPRWLLASLCSNVAAALALLVFFCLNPGATHLHAATQVGSAPYKASSTGAGNSYAPVFSTDGKHVAFVSHANNLVTNDDFAPHLDLFVRDLAARNTVLVSVSTNGYGGANDNIGLYTLSTNAQVIAFETLANNLAPGDSNRHRDIYVRDLASGVTRLITPGANGPSSNPLISEDGQRVIFESLASNLVTNDFNGTNDIFIHDLVTGVTELVTLNSSNTASPDGPSHSPTISADGLTVAFVSHATNLVTTGPIIYNGTNVTPNAGNQLGEVYARDVRNGSNIWAVASHVGQTLEFVGAPVYDIFRASGPRLSRNGQYVTFRTSVALVRYELTEPPTNILQIFPGSNNLFTYQINPRVVPLISRQITPNGTASSELFSTPDGRYLAYAFSTNKSRPTILLWVDFGTLRTNSTICCDGSRPSNYTNVSSPTLILSTNLIAPYLGPQPRQTWFAKAVSLSDDGQRVAFMAQMETAPLLGVATPPAGLFIRELTNNFASLLTTNLVGLPGPDLGDSSASAALSASLVAFESPDSNHVPDDLNRAWDVFVRNVDTGETTLVSARHPDMPTASGLASSQIAGSQSLSADGSKIVILTHDSNLTAKDTNHLVDAALRDIGARTNTMVSGPFMAPPFNGSTFLAIVPPTNNVSFSAISSSGKQVVYLGQAFDPHFNAGLGHTNLNWRDLESNASKHGIGFIAGNTAMSPDGRLVAYHRHTSLDSAQSRGLNMLDCRNLPATNMLVSSSRNSQTENANGPSINPAFSPDSRWIVFQSLATDLTYDPDLISGYQIYAREIDTAFIKRISYDSVLQTNVYPLPGGATNPVFSADARFVFFDGATNRTIYRHDLLNDMNDAGTERRLNLEVCTGCANPSPSSEGCFVAYETRSTPGGVTNILLKDLESGTVELVSMSLNGTNANGSSFSPLLSHDARFVVFASRASDLVPGDNNRATDIFVRDRWAGATHCLSRNLAGNGTGNRVSSNPVLSADGRTVAFQSFASDLVVGDYNDTRDVFVVTLGGPDTDGDGMEDDWELAHFNTLDRDGSGDFDNDGASDRDEFRAGTNPSSNASILRVLRLTTSISAGTPAPRTTIILWNAVPGKTYRVETKNDLNSPWTIIGSDVTAGSTTASATHALTGNEGVATAQSFYRVTLMQ